MRAALRLVGIALAGVLILRSVQADTPVGVLPTIDFKAYFPWLVWVSSEGHDSAYPSGFRYKMLSVRSADSSTVEFALVRELADGTKVVAIRGSGALAGFEATSTKTLGNLGRTLGVTFQEFDLRDVKDFAGLQQKIHDFGWEADALPK